MNKTEIDLEFEQRMEAFLAIEEVHSMMIGLSEKIYYESEIDQALEEVRKYQKLFIEFGNPENYQYLLHRMVNASQHLMITLQELENEYRRTHNAHQ